MVEIRLSNGATAVVDDEDFERVSKHSWSMNRDGYAKSGTSRPPRYFLMHRFVLDAPKGTIVDHINHDRLDNRKANLRLCTTRQNTAHRKAVTGVTWHKKGRKWQAALTFEGKTHYLGLFVERDAAQAAYAAAAQRLNGAFAAKVAL